MISSELLISKYFSQAQKCQLANALVENLQENPQDSPVLAELISDLSSDILDQIYPKVLHFILYAIESGDSTYVESALNLLKSSSSLLRDTWSVVLSKLRAGLDSPYNFVTDFQKHVDVKRAKGDKDASRTVEEQDSRNNLLNLFHFLSKLFTSCDVNIIEDPSTTDELLCLYLGHRDDKVASACSQLVRWRVESIVSQCLVSETSASYYWGLIFDLRASAASRKHTANSFVLWLRMLGSTNADFSRNAYFQTSLINQDFYWTILQSNLVGNSHENRKLCLSILQLSLKQIKTSFSASVVSWDVGNEAALLREWSRYTTLFEVLGIDTSLHQTQAAVNDILGIISNKSLIHPSWGFCLLSTGFRASMDSVRKYAAEILFSIEPENLNLLKYGLGFLEEHFLPYLMLSRHFAVRSKGPSSTETHCEYGEKFSAFITSVMKSLTTAEELGNASVTILSVMAKSRETFDAVRIYTCYGLVQGLEGKKVLEFGKHDQLLLKLFDNFSEGDLYRKTIQTLNLRLIFNFRPDSLAQIGSLLSKFNTFNGYDIFSENISLISAYISSCGYTFQDLMDYVGGDIPEDESMIFSSIAFSATEKDSVKWDEYISTCPDSVIARLMEAGMSPLPSALEERASELFTGAFENTVSQSIYDSLGLIPRRVELHVVPKLQQLWDSIQNDVVSENYDILCHGFSKLRFVNATIKKFGFGELVLDIASIVQFHSKLLVNATDCWKRVSNFYKFKENVYGEFHRLVALYTENIGLKDGDFKTLISLFSFETSHCTTVVSMTTFFKDSFTKNYVDEESKLRAMAGLLESVKVMDANRFKLFERDLHASLIEVFFHESVLRSAVSNDSLNNCVLEFAEIILSNSFGRRGLMPVLTRVMSDFQVAHSAAFEKLPFLPDLLVKIMIQQELQSSAFKLEKLIGDLYDAKISVCGARSIYTTVYGVDEVAYKVWSLSMLNSIKTSSCAKAILSVVFDSKDPLHFFKIIKPSDGAEEHVRIQLAKTVVSVIDKVEVSESIELYFQHFIHFIEKDPSPLVRVFFEWIIAQHLLKKPELSDSIFVKLAASLETHELKPILVTLYERVLYLMIQSMDRETEEKYLTKLITIIVPAASTNKAITRHFSMSLAMSIHEEIRTKNLKIDESLAAVIENMYNSASATEAFGQFRSGSACLWNIVDDLDLVHISGGLLLRLYDRDVDFIVKDEFLKYLSEAQLNILTHPVGDDKSDMWISKAKTNAKTKSNLQESSAGISSALQTKSGAWSTVMDVDAKTQMSDVKRSDLIVVASLVDKPPNLGGICRLCDVLGAGLLTIHDLAIKEHQQFKSVAVTADHWMPMAEVAPDSLVTFMRQKKAEGYTLIGLEQTDNSVVLDSNLEFPSKSLILLGREKEGVPGELLAELDLCVEIKQVGVIRSMNIQTATAVIVHAYSSQHC